MRRVIIFQKNVGLVNALLNTGRCKNEGQWLITCEDNKEDIKVLQSACTEYFKGSPYKNYKLCFAKPNDYGDFITL